MALNTQLIDMPSWMSRSSDWTQRQPNQFTEGMKFHYAVQRDRQNQALEARSIMLREQQMNLLNQQRLNEMNEADLELQDMPALNEYNAALATNPDAPVPALKSPRSFGRAAQMKLLHSRNELSRQMVADNADLNKRLLKLPYRDRAAFRTMQREGATDVELVDFLTEAEKLANENVEIEPIFDTQGNQIGTAVKGKGVKVIPHSNKMNDVDRFKATALQRKVDFIDKTLASQGAELMDEEVKTKLQADKSKAQGELEGLLGKYSGEAATEPAEPKVTIGGPGGKPAMPNVGDVRNGYKFNGQFPPSDQRAWDKVQ